MTLRQFYDWQTMGGAKDVSRLVAALEEREISWCMIGGLAVNHWAIATEVHGIRMRVASLEDTLKGKVAAYEEPLRRPSKKLKDLTDIARLLEAHPEISGKIPVQIAAKLNPRTSASTHHGHPRRSGRQHPRAALEEGESSRVFLLSLLRPS